MICRKCGKTVADGAYCLECGARQDPAPKSARRRGNGTGTAFKRGRYWYAQKTAYQTVDENGKKHRKYITKGGFSTKREALLYLESLTAKEARTTPKLIDLWTVYENSALEKLSKNKVTAYKKARQRLEPLMGRKIDTLTTADLQTVIDDKCKSYYTARDCKTVLSKLYQAACADQFVPSNLAKYIVLPKLKETEAEPFTAEEVEKIWNAWANGETFAGYMLVMIYSGMMPGELLALKKDMIDFDRCEIYGIGKKTSVRKQSALVFAECVKPVLRKLCDNAKTEKLICRQKDSWYLDYHAAEKRIGIRDLPPYSCRHTTGTKAAQLNLNASAIQKIMRHAKISTSQRYIHFGSTEAHDGLNKMKTEDNKKQAKNPFVTNT